MAFFPLRRFTMSDSQPAIEFESEKGEPGPHFVPYEFTLQPRRSFLRFLTEHNPFYLLSAACMLASCLALTNSLSWTSITRHRLLTLILTLNIYEAALLAIGLFLITRRGLRRDGGMLLLLQAFFLADFSFLNAEIATADIRTGVAINAGLLALAAVKMGIVLRVLKPSFTALQFGFVLVQLAVLFSTPLVLRWLEADRGEGDPRQFYVVWCIVGLLPALYELLTHIDRGRIVSVSPNAQAAPTTAYLALPFVSILVHMGILHWVYRVDYFGAHAAPLLLGLTLVLNRFSPTALVPRKDLLTLRLLLPAAAILVSMNNPFAYPLPLRYPRHDLTTFQLAAAGAFLVYLYCFLLPHAGKVLAAGAVAAGMYVLGPSWQQVHGAVRSGWGVGISLADRLTPKTLAGWGVVGVIASFTFLAVGFWLSLRKQPDIPEIDDEAIRS
jgi:hypothetical protein